MYNIFKKQVIMSVGSRNISLHEQNQNLTRLDRVENWIYEHPTTVKIIVIAGLLLGVALLASIPFVSPILGTSIVILVGIAGLTLFSASLLLFAFTARKIVDSSCSDHELWSCLEQDTQTQLKGLSLSEEEVNHRFANIRCPRKTAIRVSGSYLHANKIGQGITQRPLIASQAPLPEDNELFWKAVFENNGTIIDLTTLNDQLEGGVTKYYPDELNRVINYGSMSVRLIEKNGNIHVYQVENTQTKEVKNIKRLHFTDWVDFGTISLSALHGLVHLVESLSIDPLNLLWIHCRAGAGRTGTLIMALTLKEKIKKGEITLKNLESSLLDLILRFRNQRGAAFVQQEAQLELLRQYAYSLLTQ